MKEILARANELARTTPLTLEGINRVIKIEYPAFNGEIVVKNNYLAIRQTNSLERINHVMANGIRNAIKNENGQYTVTYSLLNDVVVFNPTTQTVKLNDEDEIKL
jgi:hypothetical protein